MNILFLGSGSQFLVGTDNYHSNMIIIADNDKKLLFDCGSDIRHACYRENIEYYDIDGAYISHLHSDHIGGLEWLALTNKFHGKNNHKPKLFAHGEILRDLWNNSLKGGLTTLPNDKNELDTFFQPFAMQEAKPTVWESIEFNLIEAKHVEGVMLCFGLMINYNNQNIYITADCKFNFEFYEDIYKKADLIFQDCETSKIKSNVHAHYDDLKTLPVEIKQKMWLYHCNTVELPDAKKDGFLGIVKRGQRFTF